MAQQRTGMLPLVDVFGVGVAGEPVKEVDIPSLLWIPPVGKAANGTLVAVGQIWHGLHDPPGAHGRRLIARRSQTLGATWERWTYPLPLPGENGSRWCCPQQLYDRRTSTAFLLLSRETSPACNAEDGEKTMGVLSLRSTDRGRSYSTTPVPLRSLGLPPSTPRCISPTSGAGVQLADGRLVASAVENPYRGDLVLWSDDGGGRWNVSLGVHSSGVDEGQLTQLPNGSLMIVMRNCINGDRCRGAFSSTSGAAAWESELLHHRLAYSVSHDRVSAARRTPLLPLCPFTSCSLLPGAGGELVAH